MLNRLMYDPLGHYKSDICPFLLEYQIKVRL